MNGIDARRPQQLRRFLFATTALSLAALAATPSLAQEARPAAPELPAGQAAGQPAAQAEAEQGGLTDVIVQARKVNENLQNVPVAVTVLSGDDLLERSVQRVQDLTNFTPGLLIRQGQNTPSALTLSLRGQVQTDTIITLDPSVGTYVDGVYWARSYGLNGDFLDVQSVQVLKGPQGTLFGRNTTGGAILINSNNPEMNHFSGRASLTYGRFNEFQASGYINIPILSDRIALRIAAQRFSRDGYTTNVVPTFAVSAVTPGNPAVVSQPYVGVPNGLKFDNRDRWNARAKLDIKPTDNLTLRFSGEYFRLNERGPSREILLATAPFTASNSTYSLAGTGALYVGLINGATTPATAVPLGLSLINPYITSLANNPDITSNNEVPAAYTKTQTYGFTGLLDTSFGQIQLITAYRKIDAYAAVDLDGSPFQIHYTDNKQIVDQYSGELQFTGKGFNESLDFAAGLFLFHESGFDQSISIVAPAINPVTSHFYGMIDNDSIGAYGQFTYHITDRLSFTGGGRYSIDDKGLTSLNSNYNRTTGLTTCALFNAPPIAGPELLRETQCAVTRRDSFEGFSYTAGLEFQPTTDTLLYIKTAKGFRSGGQNLRAPSAPFLLPFQPEIAYSYEAGFKSEFFNRRLRFNAAVYQTDINNIQRSTLIAQPGSATGASATILGNAGKARVRGFEVEAVAALTTDLRVSAFGAHVDPKYIRYADLSGDRSFERFDTVIRWEGGGAADYDREFGAVRLKLHVDYTHLGPSLTGGYYFPQNSATVPAGSAAVPGAVNTQNDAIVAANTRKAQDLIGARASISFNDDSYEIAVFGRNLTNDRAFVNDLLVAPVGYVSGTRNEPRTYGVTATVKF